MENLSLDWYKKQLKKLKILEKEFKKSIEKVEGSKKPYSKLKMVNDVLTVVLLDGEIIMKVPATVEDFNNVKNASVEKDIIAVFSEKNNLQEVNEHVIKQNIMLNITKGIQVLETSGDFDVKNGSVYLKGVNRSLPELLIEKFVEIVLQYPESIEDFKTDEKYISLKRFFMWCCLNPRAEVADSLYEFLVKNSFKITRQGFFVALRNVVTVYGSNELVQFVSESYTKIKAVWKKRPSDYHVILQPDSTYKMIHSDNMFKTTEEECERCDGTGLCLYEGFDDEEDDYTDICDYCDETGKRKVTEKNYEGKDLGTLTDLYLDLPNRHENRFTDDWTKTFDIRIGKVVSMPMDQCNWSTQDCAASGLHFTANEINYVGCGDQSVLMLINPMKVVGIGEKKGRCYEYLPIMTVSRDEATSILHDLHFDTIDLDEHYIEHELNDLEEKAKTNFAIEANKHEFNIPSICTIDMKNIVENLKQIKDELGKRVQEII
jgi:hypothetical protein